MGTGAFTKEMMMGSTIRNLGNTIKDAQHNEQSYVDEGEAQMSREEPSQQDLLGTSQQDSQVLQGDGEDEEDDVIDIDNPDELAARGLKRIQIEGEEEEFLMDMENNIYDLRGNFIGTTDGDQMEESQIDDDY